MTTAVQLTNNQFQKNLTSSTVKTEHSIAYKKDLPTEEELTAIEQKIVKCLKQKIGNPVEIKIERYNIIKRYLEAFSYTEEMVIIKKSLLYHSDSLKQDCLQLVQENLLARYQYIEVVPDETIEKDILVLKIDKNLLPKFFQHEDPEELQELKELIKFSEEELMISDQEFK